FAIEPSALHPAPLVLQSVPLNAAVLRAQDCVVFVQKSRRVDPQLVLDSAAIVVDCVNATDGARGAATVTRLGAALRPSMPTGALAHERV
ncbi:MAG: hypothetical protein NZ518_05675, partial [Dehalococcoidia bacterium]|nr:hypothetical protein [Dehalococcoidia bacterium]